MRFKINENLFKVTYEGNEGYVITDENPPSNQEWYYDILDKESSCPIYKRGFSNSTYKGCFKITASTFPLGNLPQFIVNGDAENVAWGIVLNNSDCKDEREQIIAFTAFMEGWSKHAEKYKFTKEDMRNCWNYSGDFFEEHSENGKLNKNFDEYIKSLQQPREIIEIEFETNVMSQDYGFDRGQREELKIIKSSDYPHGFLTIKSIKYV